MTQPALPDVESKPAEGISYFTPAQNPIPGSAANPQSTGKPLPKLFQPLTVRGVTFQNRLALSPMCQYSAQDGHMTDWHMAHLGGYAQRGPGFLMIEGTAILPEGRITPQDVGLWKDSQIEPMRRIIGIQLFHSGPKGSNNAPWLQSSVIATEKVGGWPDNVKSASDIPFAPNYCQPKAMTKQDIEEFKSAWVAAVKRAIKAGVDFVEVHTAHGFLLNSFLTPYYNNRTDEYGGSFENGIRLSLEIAQLTRDTVGPDVPVFLRVSASDWVQESSESTWTIDDTVKFAEALAKQGAIDVIDVSSGGAHPAQKINSFPGFQVPFAVAIKKAVGDKLAVAAVGMLDTAELANKVLEEDGLDFALVGRGYLKNPNLVWKFAEELGVDFSIAHQIRWPFTGRGETAYIRPSTKNDAIF
ncbi:2,4-dienoyl-CoA reductase [NADPH], putative [Talaromyces stipitatus ATCC 10500]|uniref:2,4-dienoyl-CoA reductase [NADPH], putative n=1 Tax=Talaromyces stipitatus (strain ATCC 10500 / CBS 375.48 / QM 6759 / NRRL 1006) TaxID=441959 RepID=B8MA05_TALSN|nr:2,4-dienoyl-CoA reductase [NADPH], putative [Talaromyces stipitatus ATCC 10500]EED18157.1 2,4-dienoyl-CoA reductase [NADPH], putative [Talaromyces stipitatus ATCC 10500]